METLKQAYAKVSRSLKQTVMMLSDGLLLTDADCSELIRQINELCQEQNRLFQQLEMVSSVGCSTISKLEEAVTEHQMREQKRNQLNNLRTVVRDFSSIQSVSDSHRNELTREQSELAACNDDTLIQMDESGQLEPYRRFIQCVRTQQLDLDDASQITARFGYQLPFAILMKELSFEGDPTSHEDTAEPANTSPQDRTDAAQNSMILESLYPLKNREVNVLAFRNTLKRLPIEARVLLPALTHFGVLNTELTLKFSLALNWYPACLNAAYHREQLEKTFRVLAETGFITGYQTPENGILYCLTKYGYDILHKQAIMKDARMLFFGMESMNKSFFLAVGLYKLIGGQKMDAGTLMNAFAINQGVTGYLSCLRERKDAFRLSEEELKSIVFTLHWDGKFFRVKVPLGKDLIFCRVFLSAEEYTDGAVLFLTPSRPEGSWKNGQTAFCDGQELFYWQNGWVSVAGAPTRPLDKIAGAEAAGGHASSENKKPDPAADTDSCPGTDSLPARQPESPAPCGPQKVPEENGEIDIIACHAQENAGRLLKHRFPIHAEHLLKLTVRLIAENRIAEAAVLAESAAKDPNAPEMVRSFYLAFRQSVQVPGRIYHYSSGIIDRQQEALPQEDTELYALQQTMILSTQLWAMVFPSEAYDHNLYNNAGMTVGAIKDQTIQNLIKLLSQDLKEISFQNDGLGFSPFIISSLADNGERERQIATLCSKASALKRTPTSTISITGLETCLKQMVGPASKIGCALSWIENNSGEKAETIRSMLKDEIHADFLTSDSALEDYIDRCWNSTRIDSNVRIKRLDNDTPARRGCKKALIERIAVIKDWLDIVQVEQGGSLQKYRDGYARILNQLKSHLHKLAKDVPARSGPYEAAGQMILQRTAKKMLAVLEGKPAEREDCFYQPLYLMPELMLDENGENVIVSELYGIAGLEPWSFVLRAVAAGPDKPQAVLARIDDYKAERWYRNYGSEALLCACSGTDIPDRAMGIQSARKDAEESVQSFKSNVRLSRAYGKIQEHEMETAFSTLDLVKQIYFRSHNYASFKGFLKQLNNVLEQGTEARAARYEKLVRELEETFPGAEILSAIRTAVEKRSFNTADSYINQLENGVRELPESDKGIEQRMDFLAQFQDCEEGYFQECQNPRNRSENPARWGERALVSMDAKYQHWTSTNEKKKGCIWLANWIKQKGDSNNGAKVQNILAGLGFRVKKRPVLDNGFLHKSMCEVFLVSAEKTSPGLKDYPHPIYKYGSDLNDPMYVVCLYGCKGSSTLIKVMTSELQLNGPAIVLMDGTLTIADRQLVAEKFKADTSGQSPFLLIDRVLLLYLASLDEGDRLKAMLHCTLPYTFETLYINEGSGPVHEEMFIGRVSELNALRSEQGPSLVYGGRQLGKTALLKRASKTLHDPQNRDYSFCVDIKDEGSDVLLERVNRQLLKLKILEKPCQSLQRLCETLLLAYEKGKIRRLRVFIDEVDKLFDAFRENDYKELRAFIVLRDSTNNHVKFVFAGTHNVAATAMAEQENSNLLHMGSPLCIRPLSPSDAAKLIRIPMKYLGFEIGDSQISLILSNTSSYPGLIHMFCCSLVQSVCRDYELYYSGGQARENPPYHISDEQMQAVFKEKDIRKEIKNRVMATIKLNQKYRVISCLLAHMIYEDQEKSRSRLYGHSAQELLKYDRHELKLPQLREMSEKDMETLLDEMVNMGILWKNEQTGQFRFCQQDFLDYIGTSDQVLELLLNEQREDAQ